MSGIFVIVSKNPIISVLFLISLFLNISGFLITSGISFIGLSYILIYVGAVSILFLFILMLINIRISELVDYTNNSVPLSILISIAFISILYVFPYIFDTYHIFINPYVFNDLFNVDEEIMYTLSKTWEASLTENKDISVIGNVMYTTYFIWLIVTSLILLLSMVGCICLVIG